MLMRARRGIGTLRQQDTQSEKTVCPYILAIAERCGSTLKLPEIDERECRTQGPLPHPID
jgi:hypothetical protein